MHQISHDRVFVLDTNVLLYDWKSLYAFTGATIVIPLVVLEELDKFKAESTERGRNARRVIRVLDELRGKGSLSEGVIVATQDGQSLLRVVQSSPTDLLMDGSNDNKIIAAVGKLQAPGAKVTFISKDINARVKTDLFGLDAEDYVTENVSIETQYKGWSEFALPASDVKAMNEQRVLELVNISDLHENQFIHVKTDFERQFARLFRFTNGKAKEVFSPGNLWGFHEKNIQQLMALDLLLDDSLSLVSLIGPAGTGKTFLTLLAALHKVMKENVYRKLLVARPVVALGSDIGFLPGDVKEKLFHWMKPMYDNLELILAQSKKGIQQHLKDDASHGGNRKALRQREYGHAAGRDHHRDRRHGKHAEHRGLLKNYEDSEEWTGSRLQDISAYGNEIDKLMNKGIVSFEAITYMRGRSIPQQFIFIDEVQNLTPHEVKTIVSRAGEGTKVILAGDADQIDSPYMDYASNGLTVTTEKFKGERIFGAVKLEICERSALAERAAKLL
jgi:PhoH-like ATPase